MFKDIDNSLKNMSLSVQNSSCEENCSCLDSSCLKEYVEENFMSPEDMKLYNYAPQQTNDTKFKENETCDSLTKDVTKNNSPILARSSEINSENSNCVKNELNLTHSLSLPNILQILDPSISSINCSLPSSIDILNIEPRCSVLNTNTKFSVSKKKDSEETTMFDNLYKNIVSVENLTYTDVPSCNDSISTVRDRFNSVDSSYSLISTTDLQGIDDAFKKETAASNNWRPQHSRSNSDFQPDFKTSGSGLESRVFSLPNSFSEKEAPRKSIFGKQMVVPTECFFPRPQQGQSLTSFLSSNQFNISAELDRENAHFCISEALISAIEHMKCTLTQNDIEDDSDEEIQKLTQRIRIRKRERQREKTMKNFALLSDGRTDTTSQSASPPLSSHSSDFEADSIKSEDEVEDIELSAHTESNLSSINESGLSLSMASLYSDADIQKSIFLQKQGDKKFQESDSLNLSAEAVALSLLKRFSEKHLPKASELQWLVSEQEVPQRLLPLPDSWPISPDCVEEEYYLTNIRLRGNLEWAPPRAQIISIIHPHLKRKEVIERQKYRCAGCGMKIEKSLAKKFRYCNYFGKYFCQCCHSNGLAYIPGFILWKWDFTKYYVSKFAWDLLDNMFYDPLFNIEAINQNLYKKVKSLELCRQYRLQLFYLKDFMKTCRKADLVQVTLEAQSQHIICDIHLYSLSDLLQVKSGEMLKHLKLLTNYCLEHVKQCILCQAKGFICEICKNERDVIFSYQLDKVLLCQACGCCFHKCCFKNVKCPRCIRIAERKKRFSQERSNDLFV